MESKLVIRDEERDDNLKKWIIDIGYLRKLNFLSSMTYFVICLVHLHHLHAMRFSPCWHIVIHVSA